jgi:hypothetical protein
MYCDKRYGFFQSMTAMPDLQKGHIYFFGFGGIFSSD